MSNLVGGCTLGQDLIQVPLWKMQLTISCASARLKWGCTGFILSVILSSALAMELLQSFTKPLICDKAVNFTVDVVLWTELCPHYISQTSSQILFIFIDLIDQLQNFILILWCFFLSFKIWTFPEFLNSWLSTSCSGFPWMSSYIRISFNRHDFHWSYSFLAVTKQL